MESGQTWPEQEAIDKWFALNTPLFPPIYDHVELLHLKKAVTAPRLKVQETCDRLREIRLRLLSQLKVTEDLVKSAYYEGAKDANRENIISKSLTLDEEAGYIASETRATSRHYNPE